jgi:hypothetical protein
LTSTISGGASVARQEILVGTTHRAGQQLVAHRASVDEEILVLAGRPVQRRQAGESGEAKALAVGVDRHRIVGELAPHDGGQPFQPRRIGRQERALGGGKVDQRPLLALQPEGDLGMGHGQPAHRVGDMARLGARLLQELEPRRRREEQLAHFHPCALRMRGGPRLALGAAVDLETPGGIGAGRPRGDGEAADRGNRGQRLAAKTQRADVGQVVVGQLGGAVALDRKTKLVGRHADPVVDHGDERAATLLQGHRDTPRAGIERVLDQLLHGARRTLDHLACGDAVDERRGQATQGADGAHGAVILGRFRFKFTHHPHPESLAGNECS